MASTPRTEGAGVEVVLSSLKETDRPSCPHGPTILFERFCNGNIKRFYACSSSRDRKVCSFYQSEADSISDSTKQTREEYIKSYRASLLNRNDFKRLKKALVQQTSERRFCRSCHLLLLLQEDDHEGHKVVTGVTDQQLSQPTKLLAPLENNKSNAQYLFSEKTKDFITSTIDKLGFTHVLCVGAPTVHENLRKQQSMLLDIDARFYQFYNAYQFNHYNMFNHYFFDGKEAEIEYTKFLQEAKPGKLLVLLDPPFGGLVDLIIHTLESITTDYRKLHETREDEEFTNPSVFWFFPYFMEQRITAKQPDLRMLDYKVDYANHESFQDGPKGRKHGSPVRLFTNIGLSHIELPAKEGYKFCSDCQKYVSKENKHCDICKDCTSKDGKPYIHCDVCERCVKPSRVHCFKCQMCLLPNHECGAKLGAGCYICGDFTHKRKDCPLKNNPPKTTVMKRKLPAAEDVVISKRRKHAAKGKRPKKKKPGELFKKSRQKQKRKLKQ